MVFDKLFGKKRKPAYQPDISFGRYSDNNKSLEKVARWTAAESLFKKGNYFESLEAFFDYLRDDAENNIELTKLTDDRYRFEIYQGSKVIRGHFTREGIVAESVLAKMPVPNVPVMRRLLEMNFRLFYTRYLKKGEDLCMRFDSPIKTGNPNKLYYGLKELCVKADKQDDLLVQEFGSLLPVDIRHVEPLPDNEKEIKFRYFQQWLNTSLEFISTLDEEKFSGAISYLLLTLVFRIDFLIRPEGKLLADLENVAGKYYEQTEKSAFSRNLEMKEALAKIREWPKEEILSCFFRSKYSFSIVSPVAAKKITENLNQALQNMYWYRDNNYSLIANEVMEYGMSFNQFSYSLPKPLIELHTLFMQINHSNFFKDLGFLPVYYDLAKSRFDEEEIHAAITTIIEKWKGKYPALKLNLKKLKFDGLVRFNQSFIQEIMNLNLDI